MLNCTSEPVPKRIGSRLRTPFIPCKAETKTVHACHFSYVVHLLGKSIGQLLSSYTLRGRCCAIVRRHSWQLSSVDTLQPTQPLFNYLKDTLILIVRFPEVAARVYRRSSKDGTITELDQRHLDISANLARMMGFGNPQYDELIRLYLSIHSDHEGGEVSSHTIHLVGSALGDPYYSLSAGLNGLSGPLHGLASQKVLRGS